MYKKAGLLHIDVEEGRVIAYRCTRRRGYCIQKKARLADHVRAVSVRSNSQAINIGRGKLHYTLSPHNVSIYTQT